MLRPGISSIPPTTSGALEVNMTLPPTTTLCFIPETPPRGHIWGTRSRLRILSSRPPDATDKAGRGAPAPASMYTLPRTPLKSTGDSSSTSTPYTTRTSTLSSLGIPSLASCHLPVLYHMHMNLVDFKNFNLTSKLNFLRCPTVLRTSQRHRMYTFRYLVE